MLYLGVAIIAVGVLFDLASLYCRIRRWRGDGLCGVPVLGLICYVGGAACLAFAGPDFSILWLFAALVVFHLLCQFVIVLILFAWTRLFSRDHHLPLDSDDAG
jgi:hypothetical protein